MKKPNADNTTKVVIINPPTQQQAEERIKKLSAYLSEIWRNSENIK